MAKLSGITTPSLTFDEVAAPSTPAAAKVILYAKADGLLYSKDDAGTETVVTGTGSGSYSGAKARRSTNQSLTNNTSAAIQFDAADDWDVGTWHDPATNNTRMTVPTGVTRVRVIAWGRFANNGTGDRMLEFAKNGVTTNERVWARAAGTWMTEIMAVADFACVATDYFEVYALQNSGGALNLEAAAFSIEKLS